MIGFHCTISQLFERRLAVNWHIYNIVRGIVRRVQIHVLRRVRRVLYSVIHIQTIHRTLIYILSVSLGEIGGLANNLENILLLPGNV